MGKIFVQFYDKRFFFVSVIVVALLTMGFGIGWYSGIAWLQRTGEGGQISETRLVGYDFINPLLECDAVSDELGQELLPFHHKVETLIAGMKQSHWVTHVSVYFRAMNNGLAFSIHGKEKFAPASLLKVPLAMAYFKWAEKSPSLLMRQLIFNMADATVAQVVKPAKTLEPGRIYTVDELLYRTLVYSDNNAYFLLYASVDPAILHGVYRDLGLEIPRVRDVDDFMTVTEYAAFFRMLYNGSYISKELSEKALRYLSEADFRLGLVSGVPPGVTVAHKFGEKILGATAEIKQLHDCGIVYYPKHPYLLCVMSRGDSFEYLDDAIRSISSLVYEEVVRQHGGH